MEKGIIITLPRHDIVTEYLSQFSIEVEDEANKAGILIKSLKDKDVNLKEFEKVIKKLNYRIVFFNGHGNDREILGHGEVLVKAGINESLLKDRIVYARACDAASFLGPECVKESKEGCFIGYDRKFKFYTDTQWAGNPLKDNLARLFLDPSNLVPISLIKGNTAATAHEKSKKSILKAINKVLRDKQEGALQIAETLWNNYEGQILCGNPLASI